MAARLPCHGPVGIIISYLANTSQRQRREVDGAIFHLTRSTFFPFFFSKKTQIHPHEHKTEYTKFYSQFSFELRSSVLDPHTFPISHSEQECNQFKIDESCHTTVERRPCIFLRLHDIRIQRPQKVKDTDKLRVARETTLL